MLSRLLLAMCLHPDPNPTGGEAPPFNPSAAAASQGGDTDIDADLFPDGGQEADAIWAGGKEQAASDNPVGTFNAIIEDAVMGRSMSSDRLQIHYKLQLTSGQFAGKTISKYDGLQTAQQAKISQQQLARLGVPVKNITKMNQIPGYLLQIKGKAIVITCKQNGQYYNIFFQRMLGENVGSAGAGGTSVAPAAGGGSFARPAQAGGAPAKPKF